MSGTVLGIAIAMAAPVFVVGAVTRNAKAIHVAACVMFFLALITGNIAFFLADAVAVGLAWFLALSIFTRSK